MRPIDADALINDIKNEAEKTIDEGDIVGSFWLGYITGLVDIQPTAQLNPKTGKWMLGFDNRYMEKYYYCSCCGSQKFEESKPLDCYCSKCGADMRER